MTEIGPTARSTSLSDFCPPPEPDDERAGYAPSTVSSQLNLLSMLLADAADERLIPSNPVRRRRRRGRRSRRAVPERVRATPEQAVRIAEQTGVLGGPIAWLLVITAAWTGCRWCELAG